MPGLVVTPSLLLTEYLGDGFLMADAKKRLQQIELGTYGFEQRALLDLLPKLSQHGLDFRLKTNNALYLRGGRVQKFLDYVGPCPVPALAYEWQSIVAADSLWRGITSTGQVATLNRSGSAVQFMLECGHSFRKPASRLRSPRTNLMICSICEMQRDDSSTLTVQPKPVAVPHLKSSLDKTAWRPYNG